MLSCHMRIVGVVVLERADGDFRRGHVVGREESEKALGVRRLLISAVDLD